MFSSSAPSNFSPSAPSAFFVSVCSYSYDGSPVKRPFTNEQLCLMLSVTTGSKPQCTQSRLWKTP